MNRLEVASVCSRIATQAADDVNPEPFSHDGHFIGQVVDDDGTRFAVCIIKIEKE